MQIHEKIEKERVKAGLTQEEMAEKLNIKRSTYQYWERKTPGIDKIKLVARALNLPYDYFFVTEDEKLVAYESKPYTPPPADPLERILHEKELLLQEKEARRQEAAERARRAEEQNDRLLDIIKENLNLLQTNSTKSLVYAETLLRVVQADDTVIMDNQDEGLNHEKGSSVAKAGKLEISIAQAQQQRDSAANAHKSGNT